MHVPPRLRLEPRPSRIGCVLVAIVCAVAAALVAALPLSFAIRSSCFAAIAAVALSGARQCVGHGVPRLIHVGLDRSIAVTGRDGRTREGTVLADSYVGASLTTVVWRDGRTRWWQSPSVILVLPDSLPREDFRRLRVFLRFGQPTVVDATSGTDAG